MAELGDFLQEWDKLGTPGKIALGAAVGGVILIALRHKSATQASTTSTPASSPVVPSAGSDQTLSYIQSLQAAFTGQLGQLSSELATLQTDNQALAQGYQSLQQQLQGQSADQAAAWAQAAGSGSGGTTPSTSTLTVGSIASAIGAAVSSWVATGSSSAPVPASSVSAVGGAVGAAIGPPPAPSPASSVGSGVSSVGSSSSSGSASGRPGTARGS